jgi:hypothetical protein
LQWSLAFTAIVKRAVERLVSVAGKDIPLYQEEDVISLLSLSSITCFEQVVICGAMDLSTPFLVDEEEAAQFENLTNDYLGLPSVNQVASPNDYIRVTILARSSNRFFVNLVLIRRFKYNVSK